MTNKFFPYAVAISFLAATCTTPNPNSRRPGDDGGSDSDASPKTCPATCPAPTTVCDTQTGQCVICTATDSRACTGTSPVCHADNTCYGCMAHSECGSSACLADGSCASASAVAYVDPRGADNPTCDQATPCVTLRAALDTKRPYIKMTGETRGSAQIVGQAVTILADPQAKLLGDSGLAAIDISRSQVTIFDLEISSIPGSSTFGVTIEVMGHAGSTVSLQRVTISKTERSGVLINGGKLEMVRSTIKDNLGYGIAAFDMGRPEVSRSTIIGNRLGGVYFSSDESFHFSNNFIVKNGSATSDVGGVHVVPRINADLSNDQYNVIKFNTIADNQAGGVAAQSGGIRCDGAGRTAALETNLILRNSGGAGNPQTVGTGCIAPTVIDPSTNPGFRLSTTDDFHLTSATPLVIRDVVLCDAFMTDIDGDVRSPGGKCDLGADEYRP